MPFKDSFPFHLHRLKICAFILVLSDEGALEETTRGGQTHQTEVKDECTTVSSPGEHITAVIMSQNMMTRSLKLHLVD